MQEPENLVTRSDSNDDREERLARLMQQLLHESQQGEIADFDSVVAENADIADELRELWATAMIADECAELADDFFIAETLDSPAVGSDSVSTFSGSQHAITERIGDYELIEEIGRGGMGVVFKARQLSLGRIVALKMILRGGFASATDVARFRAEAESAAGLDHPHIVPVYEVGEHEEQPFFSMKFVDGSTLAAEIRNGPLPPRKAAELLVPICRAIAEAHRHGLLHRDLKPSNILIDREGRSYVSDFGLAKRLRTDSAGADDGDVASFAASLTQSGAILGTPEYMAPEQAAGRRGVIGPATDVYSLGALLYATLTGRPPFQGASAVDVVLMVLEQDPLLPRILNPHVDPDLEMIALKCLQKPADLRYRDADALADDLKAYLANEPISASSSQFTEIISRAFRETHHAGVLENWGLLWMLHSAVLLVLCGITNWLQWQGVTTRLPYLAMWSLGLGLWAAIFWNLRHRSGPITFVERQIAHVWAGSMICSTMLFAIEALLGLDVLQLSPVLGLVSGAVFLVKAGILSGAFYVQAGLLFLTGIAMAVLQRPGMPNLGILLFGIVSAGSFFFPGLKYYRQNRKSGGRKTA